LVALALGTPRAQAQQRETPSDPPKPPATPSDPAPQQTPPPATPTSPLTIHIGDSDLTIGGFMDMTSVTRSTNTGNGLGANFSNFPFTTTAAGALNPTGNMSETRFSAQNSRLTLQATSKWNGASIKGYLEADFLGNTAQNLNVTSNSNGLRMRLYWAQYQKGKFEFLGGQSWSFITPGRNGLSPAPGDIFFSQDVDTNYQMGLTWQRTPGFRFIYHASDTVSAGLALENPQQYVGGAVVLPKAFPVGEVDTGSGGSAVGSSSPTPNAYPDIIGKIAFDPKTGKGTHQHIDAAMLIRGFKTYNPANDTSFSSTGFSGSVNFVIEAVKNFKLVALNYWSKGGGRIIANTGTPDFIVNPDFSMSLVHAFDGIYGVEVTAPKTTLYGYYSMDKIDKNVTLDADGKTPIGYGIDGSQSANNKIYETTVGIVQTFFKDPKIGGLQLMVQFSYLKRTPFLVPAGTPADAKMKEFYVNFRYILP
jgi:hypothetical protein